MIRFGICDDDREYAYSIKDIICQAFNKFKTFDDDAECIYYNSGKELLEKFEQDNIDIFFMDIECGEDSGFDIARELVKRTKDLGIVYITNHKHYISNAFVCRPLGFICKSNVQDDIIMPMMNIVEFLEDKKKTITFKDIKSDIQLKISDIIIVEVFNHKIQITLKDKIVECQGQLSKYEPSLMKYGFIKISRGILVNIEHITDIKGSEIYLNNDIKYEISRRRVNEVYEMWRKAGGL